MFHGKITSKGQTTIPKEIRKRLNLKPGDRIIWYFDGDRLVVRAKNKSVMDLAGMLHRPGMKALTIEEINDAIGDAAAESAMGGLKPGR